MNSYRDILSATDPEMLQKLDRTSLVKLLQKISDETAKSHFEKDIAPIRNRAEFVRLEIQKRTEEENHKTQWDMWSADMFQKIHGHETAMKTAKDQLEHQKISSKKAMLISIAAALAAIVSAFLAWLAYLQKPPLP